MKKCPKCGKLYETTNTLCPNDGTVLVKTGDALLGQTLASKYRVEERISEGGMGTVYRGTHVLMEKQVAIKVLHPSLAADDKIVARFTREAKAASRISHPHALNVTDFGEADNGIVFLIMEYLRGQTLKQIIRTEGPLPLARVVEITRQVAGALDAAHAEGVVHRDLKSDNIMLEEIGGGGNGNDWAKVLDFGIAKIQEPVGQDPELTAPNLIIGTPQYMSPEQCSQSGEIDKRSDVYSFGVILYEMLTGHVPFTGDSATAIMLKHLQEPAPSILDERKDLPPSVAYVVAKALSKRREDRQQSAGELAEALATAAEAEVPASAGLATAEAARETGEHRRANTDRIVVPTGSHEGRTTANDDYDEATVVRPAPPTVAHRELDELAAYDAPPPASNFSPWKIMIPAALSLLVIIGVFYAMSQRGAGQPAANDNAAPLTTDPNAQAVQPLSTPTGAGESAIVPTATTVVVPNTASGAPATATGLPTGNDNSVAAQPSPAEQQGGDNSTAARNDNANTRPAANDNRPQNDNANADTEPTPPPSRNDNRHARPTPTDTDEPPPPTPKPTPRATPPPASTPPPVVTAPVDDSPPPPAAR